MSSATKDRILAEAGVLFADRGFHNTTVRDIALRAKTNVASINYHFRSKEELYRAVVRALLQDNLPAPVAESSGDRDHKLQHFVHQLISAPEMEKSEDRLRLRIIAWEMLSPTGVLDHGLSGHATPYLTQAQAVVREFLPTNTLASDVEMHALWLVGQCLIFRQFEASDTGEPITSEAIAARVTRLALKALALG